MKYSILALLPLALANPLSSRQADNPFDPENWETGNAPMSEVDLCSRYDSAGQNYFALQIEHTFRSIDVCDEMQAKLSTRPGCSADGWQGCKLKGSPTIREFQGKKQFVYTTWWWFNAPSSCPVDTPVQVAEEVTGYTPAWLDGNTCHARNVDLEGARAPQHGKLLDEAAWN